MKKSLLHWESERLNQRKSIICCGEENVLRHISRILGSQFIVHGLRTPALAVARLKKEADCHAFITEQSIAGTGFEALRAARELRPNVRRVMLTEYGDLTGIIAGLHSGIIQNVVQLPIRDVELLAAVCTVLPQSTAANHSFA
jgi:DNA-binding NarL/FixJ family response regulator